jgi:hypothetical protein
LVSLLLAEMRAQDFAGVDAHARSVPFPEKQNIHTLAKSLSQGCTTEKETVRAFFIWIADNIQYDIKGAQNKDGAGLEDRVARQAPQRVLQSKKAVCAGYSNLFVALCEAADIQAFKVDGFTKDEAGKISPEGHSWCIVRADGAWGLIDPTWGAGEVGGDKYYKNLKEAFFFADPKVMIADHYPYDPLFQLLPSPINWQEFQRPVAKATLTGAPLVSAPRTDWKMLTDSLNAFAALDSLQQMYSIGTRVLQINPTSNYGLYHLGSYYYEKGDAILTAFDKAYQERRKNRTRATSAWCDQQYEQMQIAQSLMSQSLKVSGKMKESGKYSDSVKVLHKNAEIQLRNIQVNVDICNLMCRKS